MSRPLQLFMTTDAVGGVWTYALDLAGALAEHGVEITLAQLGPRPGEDQLAAAAGTEGVTLLETGLPLDWTANSPDDLRLAGKAIADLARDFQADVVQLNTPALAAFGDFDLPLVVACHSCVATWWAAVKGGEPPQDFIWRTELVGQAYRAADVLVAPTRAFSEQTARTYGLELAPATIHNGRGPFTADVAPAGAPTAPYVFTAGRLWDEGKGLAVLDRAAARIQHPVCAAGPLQGPQGDHVDAERLQLLGRLSQEEVAAWMQGAAVFAAPSLYEPFGLGVLEAAQAGCALVLSDIPSFRELWDGAAVFTAPGDAAELAAAVQELITSEGRRDALAAASMERAGRYTAAAMAEGMAGIYDDAISTFEAKRA